MSSDPTSQSSPNPKRTLPTCPFPTRQQHAEFHAILRAARLTGVPMDLGGRSIDELEMRTSWTDEMPETYMASLVAFVTTGRSDLALERLQLSNDIDAALTTVTRSVWLYLSLMLIVAAIGMVVFAKFSTPTIEAMRADMALLPKASVGIGPTSLNRGISATYLYAAALVCAFGSLAIVVLIGTTRFAAESVAWIGGNRYRSTRNAAFAEKMLRSRLNDRSTSGLSHEYLQSLAASRLIRLRVLAPMILIILLGGGGAMAYGWLLFSPLVSLIYDLSESVIWSTQ
ncbi:hypothetical protein [Neorhodopirellula pilleata]|uniref:Uncharacterized protein n=1 Tax=Neorhodopirellula pilleata TaxID=2714738 RepID=A0A5C6A6N2_9BACT|nr:hypothetical protein [Neorhodopirellula pilleata]TWT95027.1 hypothetical protein Pla100_36060 [Neorhodopirellula pilleata]